MDAMDGIRTRIQEVVRRTGYSEREFGRRAGLASETHIGLIVSGKTKEIQVRTLELIAAFGGVSVEYLRTGRVDDGRKPYEHADPEFQAAARAFLELRKFSADAQSVVADYAGATTERRLDAEEWFEELLLEHRRRGRGVTLPFGAEPAAAPVSPAPAPRRSARAKPKTARAAR